jgi:acetyl-CoA carboxylase biotin carboxyl carrier protein
MDLKKIQRLIRIVEDANISHFSIDEDGSKIEIKKEPATPISAPVSTFHIPSSLQTQSVQPASAPDTSEPASPSVDPSLTPIKAQMVGTFYTAASPDAAPFVKLGDTISAGQTLCIIEAMKLFNEIESDIDGVITEICVKNGETVEFGQPLFYIK